jgi:hypothetical protein
MSDRRRVDRVITIAEAMASSPGNSIPNMFRHRYDIKAAYNLFGHSEASPDNLQSGHRELIKDQMQQAGEYLLLEDRSEFSWSGNNEVNGLGPIGDGAAGLQGFLLHTVLVTKWNGATESGSAEKRPPLEIVGLVDQRYSMRRKRLPGQLTTNQEGSKKAKERHRESEVWSESLVRLGKPPEESRWMVVADREADIYEMLLGCQKEGYDYVIRACQDRRLDIKEGETKQRLFEVAREAKSLGECELELRARAGKPSRQAHLKLGVCKVKILSPQRPDHGPGHYPSIECTVVRVWEEPADDSEGLEWILLCSGTVENFEQAREKMQQYASRWLIEEFHKGVKTGLGAERLQLESAEKLYAAISIMSIVALRLLELKERVRFNPDDQAERCGLGETELTVLKAASRKPLKTVSDVALAIGRLGGHMNRKGDGMPGWITLWRGMNRLSNMIEGFLLARNSHEFG